jgi:3-hydroxyacyl-[acyl-carrier-protein] dehydratase
MTIDIQRILQTIPHRYPFLLVDRVLELVPHKSIVALKNVTINEPFFDGHFPHFKVMPGVLMLEALAQASALLSLESKGEQIDDKTVYYFAGIDNARFKRPVVPGDQLILKSTLLREKADVFKYDVSAWVGDELAVQAGLICTKRRIA